MRLNNKPSSRPGIHALRALAPYAIGLGEGEEWVPSHRVEDRTCVWERVFEDDQSSTSDPLLIDVTDWVERMVELLRDEPGVLV